MFGVLLRCGPVHGARRDLPGQEGRDGHHVRREQPQGGG